MHIDLLSADTFLHGHPHAQYDWLRESDPVHWHAEPNGPGFWALTTWKDVAESGRHPERFSSEPTIMIPDPDAGSIQPRDSRHKMMLMMDPRRQTRFRRLISREFTRGPAAALRPRIRELSSRIIDAVIQRGECDFVSDVAGELPFWMIVAGGLYELLKNPGAMAALRGDLSLVPQARDEMLRVVSPVIYMRRTATRDTELRGRMIKAGDKVVRYFGAANHDPEQFSDPNRFDISRTSNTQIAFGTGTHVCLGQHLARVEIDCMLEEVLTRLKDIHLAKPPEWLASDFISGIRAMPISFSKQSRPGPQITNPSHFNSAEYP